MVSAIIALLAVVMLWLSFRALFQPGIALALMWSLYGAEQLFQVGNSVFLQAGSALNFVVVGIVALSVLNAMRMGKYKGFRIPPELGLCIGLYVFAILSWVWSISQHDTTEKLIKSAPYILAFVFCGPLCATDQKQLRLAINTTVFLGMVILLGHAFSGYGRRSLVLIRSNSGDVESNPLAVASYAGYVSICALFSIYGRKFSPLIALKAVIFVLGAYVIIKSSTRGQLIALAAVSFIWLPIVARATLKRSTIISLLLGFVVVTGIIYAIYSLQDTGRWRADQLNAAQNGRVEMVTSLLEYWYSKGAGAWLFGLGSSSSYKVVGFYPHNVPAEVLGEEGLVGFAIYLSFCFCVLRRAGKIMFLPDLKQESRVNLGILLALFCFEGILSLKQGSLLGNTPFFGYGVTVGLVSHRFARVARRTRTNRGRIHQSMLRPYPGETRI